MEAIILEKIIQLIKEGGKLIKARESADCIHQKGEADYVTAVDIKVQEYLFKELEKITPQYSQLGEEAFTEVDLAGKVWVLDPIDGTTNFIHDYKHSAISLALIEKKEVVLGIIYDPYREELFLAQKGKGATLNGYPISVSQHTELSECLIGIGTSPYYKELAAENFRIFEQVFRAAQDIRRSGSAALDLAYVACGRLDGYLEKQLKIWDYAAGLLLIKEAGGSVYNEQGEKAELLKGQNIVAGNKEVALKLLKICTEVP